MTTTASSRGRGARLPRTVRRAQLLVAAQEVFVRAGYHAATAAGGRRHQAILVAVRRTGASRSPSGRTPPAGLTARGRGCHTHVGECGRAPVGPRVSSDELGR